MDNKHQLVEMRVPLEIHHQGLIQVKGVEQTQVIQVILVRVLVEERVAVAILEMEDLLVQELVLVDQVEEVDMVEQLSMDKVDGVELVLEVDLVDPVVAVVDMGVLVNQHQETQENLVRQEQVDKDTVLGLQQIQEHLPLLP